MAPLWLIDGRIERDCPGPAVCGSEALPPQPIRTMAKLAKITARNGWGSRCVVIMVHLQK
jgi:hypothetical protein